MDIGNWQGFAQWTHLSKYFMGILNRQKLEDLSMAWPVNLDWRDNPEGRMIILLRTDQVSIPDLSHGPPKLSVIIYELGAKSKFWTSSGMS